VKADGTFTATATSDVGAGGSSLRRGAPIATIDARSTAKLDATSLALSSINVEAYGTRNALATSAALAEGLVGVAKARAEATIADRSTTEAIIGSSADITLAAAKITDGTAAIVVKAEADNDAQAFVASHSLGGFTVSVTSPSGEIDATTSAQLLGNVGSTTTATPRRPGTLGVAALPDLRDGTAYDTVTAKVTASSQDHRTAAHSERRGDPDGRGEVRSGHISASGDVSLAESHRRGRETHTSSGGAIDLQHLPVAADGPVDRLGCGRLVQAGALSPRRTRRPADDRVLGRHDLVVYYGLATR
jgi:hypothetical protein